MQLQSLNVSSNKLRVLTREIGSCSKLLVLNLSSNELQVLPDELGAIKSLHILDVSHNKVCGSTIPRSIHQYFTHSDFIQVVDCMDCLASLEVLKQTGCSTTLCTFVHASLLDTQIRGAVTEHIGLMTALSEFKCAHNAITALPQSFGALSNLACLDCSHNSIAMLPQVSISYIIYYRNHQYFTQLLHYAYVHVMQPLHSLRIHITKPQCTC
jgi:Leucine-rich repeat (LRR) protein